MLGLPSHMPYQDTTYYANMTMSHQMQALGATITSGDQLEHLNHPGYDTVTLDLNSPNGVHIIPEIPQRL